MRDIDRGLERRCELPLHGVKVSGGDVWISRSETDENLLQLRADRRQSVVGVAERLHLRRKVRGPFSRGRRSAPRHLPVYGDVESRSFRTAPWRARAYPAARSPVARLIALRSSQARATCAWLMSTSSSSASTVSLTVRSIFGGSDQSCRSLRSTRQVNGALVSTATPWEPSARATSGKTLAGPRTALVHLRERARPSAPRLGPGGRALRTPGV
jgi:hypothetical protein